MRLWLTARAAPSPGPPAASSLTVRTCMEQQPTPAAQPSLAGSSQRQRVRYPAHCWLECMWQCHSKCLGGGQGCPLGLTTTGMGNPQALSSLICKVKCLGHQNTTDILKDYLLSWLPTITWALAIQIIRLNPWILKSPLKSISLFVVVFLEAVKRCYE